MNQKILAYYAKCIVTKPKSVLKFGRFLIQNTFLMIKMKINDGGKSYVKGKVSIITPTHKRLEKLKEAIESVQNQTYGNWQQIIISDGYDHDVEKMIRNLNDHRICYSYTYKLNVMGNYQRNVALKYADGEFVLYLDDDNIIFENCLKSMVEGFSSTDIGYVTAPIRYGDGVLHPKIPYEFGKVDLLNYMIRRALVNRFWGQDMHAVADLHMIQKASAISSGNHIDELIGHHR